MFIHSKRPIPGPLLRWEFASFPSLRRLFRAGYSQAYSKNEDAGHGFPQRVAIRESPAALPSFEGGILRCGMS
jgi:hypothetical protein